MTETIRRDREGNLRVKIPLEHFDPSTDKDRWLRNGPTYADVAFHIKWNPETEILYCANQRRHWYEPRGCPPKVKPGDIYSRVSFPGRWWVNYKSKRVFYRTTMLGRSRFSDVTPKTRSLPAAFMPNGALPYLEEMVPHLDLWDRWFPIMERVAFTPHNLLGVTGGLRQGNLRAACEVWFGKRNTDRQVVRAAGELLTGGDVVTWPPIIHLAMLYPSGSPTNWIADALRGHRGPILDQPRAQIAFARRHLNPRRLHQLITGPGLEVGESHLLADTLAVQRHRADPADVDFDRPLREVHDQLLGVRTRRRGRGRVGAPPVLQPRVRENREIPAPSHGLDGWDHILLPTVRPQVDEPPVRKLERYDIRFPKDTDELDAWGDDQSHCVGSYGDDAARGRYVFFGVFDGGKLEAVGQLSPPSDQVMWRLRQFYLKYNRRVPDGWRDAVCRAVEQFTERECMDPLSTTPIPAEQRRLNLRAAEDHHAAMALPF